ncbi:MAG: hypothetical protein HDQ93_03580 [Desulfovibrio sp.]|nr:hypothetical protein [Desulfovibrio sp.]
MPDEYGKICEYCGEEFKTPHKLARYCSRNCAENGWRRELGGRCLICGRPVRLFYRRFYCSDACWQRGLFLSAAETRRARLIWRQINKNFLQGEKNG